RSWPAPASTARPGCGTRPRESGSASPLWANDRSSSPWRSAPTARSWPPAATTKRGSCGTRRSINRSKTSPGEGGQVNSVAFSPDGKLLASGGQDPHVMVREAAAPYAVHFINARGAVFTVAFSPDGKFLATGGKGGTVRLWNPTTGLQIGQPLG